MLLIRLNKWPAFVGKKGKGHKGTYMQDLWTKTTGEGLRVGGGSGWGGVGCGKVVAGKWRQPYLNSNKKIVKNKQTNIPKVILHL